MIGEERPKSVKKPYLIQRAKIRTPLAPAKTRLSQAVNFDYMGSSEFEFGALPASFRRIQKMQSHWEGCLIPTIQRDGHVLRMFSAFDEKQLPEYIKHLQDLREGKVHTKEHPYFAIVDDSKNPDSFGYTNFWWDISNDVMFTFHKMFANRLMEYVAESLIFMDDTTSDRRLK